MHPRCRASERPNLRSAPRGGHDQDARSSRSSEEVFQQDPESLDQPGRGGSHGCGYLGRGSQGGNGGNRLVGCHAFVFGD